MECKRCLMTSDIARVNGQCEFCDMHDRLENNNPEDFYKIVRNIKKRKREYDVLVGISGGFDSSYLLYYTSQKLGLKVLALHFDNGYNNEIAERNMKRIVDFCKVDLVRVYKDEYYDEFCHAMLNCGTPDADIANDMYMADIMQTVARRYGIKYIFNGHDFRTEGSTPTAWTYMDARYMVDVYRKIIGREPKTKHLQTFAKQLYAALIGIKHIRPFHYVEPEGMQEAFELMGVESYGAKHCENDYTAFIGYNYLPNKFGIDKRKVYLSALVRSGRLTKSEAKEKLKETVEVEFSVPYNKLKLLRQSYDRYNFKRYKLLIWIMMKLNLTSYTFYKKYTQ
jgi:hypothetical protein